jgi:periplasmic protein TonB
MSYLINNQQNLNEIIFANRNKSYGAYAIRSAYGNTVFKSLCIMIFGFGTFMAAAYYYSNRNNTPDQNNMMVLDADTMVTVFDIKPEEILEIEPVHDNTSRSNPNTTSTEVISTVISNTVAVETNSTLNTESNPNTTVNTGTPGIGPETTSTLTGSTTGTTTVNSAPKDIIYVDSQPEFEGGLNALRKFVAEHVKYPIPAVEANRQGTLYVKFVVDEKGKICNLTLLNNLGYGLDEEALRVVGLLPNFKKPAFIKNEPVKVYYQLPIKFKLN